MEGLDRENFPDWEPEPKFLTYMVKRLSDELDGHEFLPTYVDNILSRITLPGAIFLGLVAILPAIVFRFGLTHSQSFAIFFGGTSLLIMVGVILDTLQQIESYLLSRHYDGLMKSGKMRSRSQSPVGGLGG